MIICEKEKCTGCYSCYNSCNQGAIQMIEDKFGYIYPNVNEKCIHCGICKKVCPSKTQGDIKFRIPQKAYASWSLDKENRVTSTSGGVASILSKKVISKGGKVFGAAYSEDLEVRHIDIDRINDISKLKGSKYVHSKVEDSFKLAKKELDNNRYVLFIGTPCQISGLYKFLKRNYEKLLTIDIVCHGVPSLKMLKEYVSEEIGTNDIDSISFREGSNYVISFLKDKKVIYRKVIRESTYFMGFMESIICRENCYSCKYARPERISDITLGDFWGVGKEKPFKYEKDDGILLVLQNTNKGERLIGECSNELFIEERPITEAINGNSQLRTPTKRNAKVDKFRKVYLTKGFNKAIKVCLRKDFNKYKLKKILAKFRIVKI